MRSIAIDVSAGLRPPRGWVERARETAIGRAVLASLAAHALALAFVPGLRDLLPALPTPERIDVVLRPSAAMPPPAHEAARPQIPSPTQPVAEPQIRQRKFEPQKRPAPPTTASPPLTAAPASEPAELSTAQAIRAVEPAPVPEVFKPAPLPVESPKPVAAALVKAPSDALIAAFGSEFKSALDKNRRYPRLAQDRGWQGTATVLIKVLPGGRLGEVTIAGSSGHDLLDDTARDMVRTAQLPAMPEPLRNHGFELRMPVEFKLI